MLTLTHLAFLFLAAFGFAWFWRAQGVREVALAAARARCRAEQLMLLDESVSLRGLWLRRGRHGRPSLWRAWEFEFSVHGDERYLGRVVTLGREVRHVELPPYRVAHAPSETLH